MSESSPHKASTIVINEWLAAATTQLTTAGVPSARLDAELLLANELEVTRSWLIAHAHDHIPSDTAKEQLFRRVHREPLAYITGKKEFYGRSFLVTEEVLIPRPESEALVSFVKDLQLSGSVVDVGTGSGCLAISIAMECADLTVTGLDISPGALAVAEANAQALSAKVSFQIGDLLQGYTGPQPRCIVANLPYVDISWERSEETNFEPSLALFAKENGLELIFTLLEQAALILMTAGVIVLEADPRQFSQIRSKAEVLGFIQIAREGFMIAFKR